MKLLHVDSSILGDASVSRAVSASIVEHLRAARPDLEVVTRDLAAHPISHLSGAYLAGQSPDTKHDQAQQEDLKLGGDALAEFIEADIVVVGSPMYNFTIPSQLKAWVDRICVAGKTFRYTEQGPQGLMGGKRMIFALSSGGIYRRPRGGDASRGTGRSQARGRRFEPGLTWKHRRTRVGGRRCFGGWQPPGMEPGGQWIEISSGRRPARARD